MGGLTAMRVHSFVPAICAGFEVPIKGCLGMLIIFSGGESNSD